MEGSDEKPPMEPTEYRTSQGLELRGIPIPGRRFALFARAGADVDRWVAIHEAELDSSVEFPTDQQLIANFARLFGGPWEAIARWPAVWISAGLEGLEEIPAEVWDYLERTPPEQLEILFKLTRRWNTNEELVALLAGLERWSLRP